MTIIKVKLERQALEHDFRVTIQSFNTSTKIIPDNLWALACVVNENCRKLQSFVLFAEVEVDTFMVYDGYKITPRIVFNLLKILDYAGNEVYNKPIELSR